MARTNRVEVEIVATDKASPKIDSLEAKIEGLEADEARIVVTSNIERTTRQLDAAQKKLDGLDGDEATVQARLVGGLEQDLEQSQKLFEQLDGATGTVRMQLDDQTMRDGTRRAASDIDTVTRSGSAANGVLANMVGNTTQDLGELGGMAGGVGVAIGQMAERMADARAEGVGMGQILREFGAVFGPIIALAGAIGIVTNLIGEQREAAEAAEARTKLFGDSLEGAADDALGLTETLRDNAEQMTKFDAQSASFLGGLQENLAAVARGIPLVGGLVGDMGQNIVNLAPIMQAANFSLYDFAQALEQGGLVGQEWTTQLLAALDAGKITEEQYEALSSAITQYGADVEASRLLTQAFTIDQEEANAALQQMLELRDPMAHYQDQWQTLMDDMRDGAIDTEAAADAIEFLKDKLGITTGAVLDFAQAELDAAAAAVDLGDKQNNQIKSGNVAAATAEILADRLHDEADAAKEAAEAHSDVAEALQDTIDARREAADGLFTLHDAERDFVTATAELATKLREAHDLYEARAILDDYAQAAGRIADAQVRIAEQQAAANGQTLSAEQRIDAWNRAMITAATTMDGPGRDAIVRYLAEVNAIPEATVTKISAALDAGKWSEARRLLDEASEARDTALEVDVETSAAEGKLDEFIRKDRGPIVIPVAVGASSPGSNVVDRGGDAVSTTVGGGTTPAAPAPNVTIINAPGTAQSTAANLDRFYGRNGLRG